MRQIIHSLLLVLILTQVSGALTELSAESHLSIRVVKPGDRRNIPTGDSSVTVEIHGADMPERYYWELYGDQVLMATVRDGSTIATVNFRDSGPHRIQVVLFDAQANRVASHEILVIAAPVEDRTDPFNRQQFAPAMAILAVTIASIIGGALWLSRKHKKNCLSGK